MLLFDAQTHSFIHLLQLPRKFSLWYLSWALSSSTLDNMLWILMSIYSHLSFLLNRRLCIPSATISPSHEFHFELMCMTPFALTELVGHRCTLSVHDYTDVVLFVVAWEWRQYRCEEGPLDPIKSSVVLGLLRDHQSAGVNVHILVIDASSPQSAPVMLINDRVGVRQSTT